MLNWNDRIVGAMNLEDRYGYGRRREIGSSPGMHSSAMFQSRTSAILWTAQGKTRCAWGRHSRVFVRRSHWSPDCQSRMAPTLIDVPDSRSHLAPKTAVKAVQMNGV
jgi:hypothetical protein